MAKSKFNQFGSALLLLVISTSISLAFGEIVIRTIVDPGDYLEAYLVSDAILGHKIEPNSAGHDSWGFRNKLVPASAKIVSIGDSQTYGVSATARNSWPAQLENLIGQKVYNLSLGGYSPVQYYYLLQNKALSLQPSIVIVGFYFGNDILETYRSVYANDYWKPLRNSKFFATHEESVNVENSAKPSKLFGAYRDWLAHHSVIYRMFTFQFGNLFRFLETKYGSARLDGAVSILEDDKDNIRTSFMPSTRLAALDLRDPKIWEGLRLTLDLLRQMSEFCSGKSTEFVIALIPTKESVFADYIEGNPNINNSSVIDQLIANERSVNQLMKKYFDEHKIAYVDLLPELRGAVTKKVPYFSNVDGHPNADGYGVIAHVMHKRLTVMDR